MLAPICLFTYNRLNETRQTIEALKNNYLANQSNLYIFSDGPKNKVDKPKVETVRNYLSTVNGFKSVLIIKAKENKGLANSIVNGVTQIFKKNGKVIVLEDDLITSQNFLDFMNRALNFYEDNVRVQSINGFSLKIKNRTHSHDVYFHARTFSWGWGTWKNRWNTTMFDITSIKSYIKTNPMILKQFNKACGNDMASMLKALFEKKIDSWYVLWVFNHFQNESVAAYPYLSKVTNIGFSKNGTHCTNINSYVHIFDIENQREFNLTPHPYAEKQVNKQFLKYFKTSYKIKYRINLLKDSNGRLSVLNDIKNKMFKKL